MDSPIPPTPPAAKDLELLHSLRRLVRGLSAIFWAVPLALLTCVQSILTDWLVPLGAIPPLATTGLLLFGAMEMGWFRPAERVWQTILEKVKMLAIINVGLSPFIFFWSRFPHEIYYRQMVWAMGVSGVLLLYNLNRALKCLANMLPDQTLREDTNLFTGINLGLIAMLVVLTAAYFGLEHINTLPLIVIQFLEVIELHHRWLLIFLILLPVSMTMSLLWKIKELVMAGLFGGYR